MMIFKKLFLYNSCVSNKDCTIIKQMIEQVSQKKNELITRLNSFISLSERAYLGLGKRYPLLLAEMEQSVAQSRSKAECFGTSYCTDNLTLEEEVLELVKQAKNHIAESEKFFSLVSQGDAKLLAILKTDIAKLEELDAIISRIREDSEEMEIISLNAMTVAIKTGTAGRGFSVITDELKRLSTKTIDLTDILTDHGKSLKNLFDSFRSEITRLSDFQEKLFTDTNKLLHENFDSVELMVKSVAEYFYNLSNDSKLVKEPILLIMQEIQLQDIIRQSVDHVIIALKELERSNDNESDADELLFVKTLFELAETLLHDVEEKVEASKSTLRNESKRVNKIVSDVESNRKSFIGEFDSKAIDTRVMMEGVHTTASNLTKYARERNILALSGDKLSRSVLDLNERFNAFTQMLSRFHTIVIASRIEVAKSTILQAMTDTVGQMMMLTERIDADVAEAQDHTKGFIKSSAFSISEYVLRCQSEEPIVQETVRGLEDRFSGLIRVRETINSDVKGFTLYTGTFLNLVADSASDISVLEKLQTELSNIQSELKQVRLFAETELETRGIEHKALTSPRLKDVIENFTIFTHKKTAGEIGGFIVEQGIETGAVTMF